MLRILVLSLLVFIANPAFAAEPPWQQRTIAPIPSGGVWPLAAQSARIAAGMSAGASSDG